MRARMNCPAGGRAGADDRWPNQITNGAIRDLRRSVSQSLGSNGGGSSGGAVTNAVFETRQPAGNVPARHAAAARWRLARTNRGTIFGRMEAPLLSDDEARFRSDVISGKSVEDSQLKPKIRVQ
jgi:hypothetical protein